LMHRALNVSLNIPALKILDTIGFDAAIDRSAALLGITDQNQIRTMFPRVYPLALGVTSTSPMRMARAFAIFANEGREVTPIAIRRIEDRNGRVILDPERDIIEQKRRRGNPQVITPQNAYVMSRIMQRTGEGTMSLAASSANWFRFRDETGEFTIPVAGKTGTTQNWADAWIVGYSPYFTTAVWFGFDRPGNSLGTGGTGAGLVGPFWGRYMRDIHVGLPRRDFVRPSTGIVYIEVCRNSGQLLTPDCTSGRVTLPFIQGTQPSRLCDMHGAPTWSSPALTARGGTLRLDDSVAMFTMPTLTLPDDLFLDLPPATTTTSPQPTPAAWNPLLDGEGFSPPLMPDLELNLDLLNVETESVEEELPILGVDAEDDAEDLAGGQELALPISNPLLD